MLKKLTFSINNQTIEVPFQNDLNVIKDREIYAKFQVLNQLKEFSVLKNSADAVGDFIEYELGEGERTYFLTMYPQNKVYEFYNDQDLDQDLARFYPKLITSKDYEAILQNGQTSYTYSSTTDEEEDIDDFDTKIKEIEDKIEKSKDFDEKLALSSNLKSESDKLAIKLSEFEKINDKLIVIEKKKELLGIFAKLDFGRFETDLKLLINEIKVKKEMMSGQEQLKSTTYDTQVKSIKSPIILGFLLTIDILITIAITFIAPLQGIAIGLSIGAVILILYFVTGQSSEKIPSIPQSHDFKEEIDLIERSKNDLIGMIGCDSETDFYAKKAQLQAYDYEIAQLKETIRLRFVDFDYIVMKSQVEEMKSKLKKLNEDVISMNSFKLEPEEYLKKRRELDMLKMDQIRNQSVKKVNNLSGSLSPLLNDLGLNVQINGNTVKAQDSQELFIACVCNSIANTSNMFGAIVDDPFSISNTFGKVSDVLQKLSQTIQILFFTNHFEYDSLGKTITTSQNLNENNEVAQNTASNNSDSITF